jgi:hypothetical protein
VGWLEGPPVHYRIAAEKLAHAEASSADFHLLLGFLRHGQLQNNLKFVIAIIATYPDHIAA